MRLSAVMALSLIAFGLMGSIATAQNRQDVRTPRFIGNDTCVNPYSGLNFYCPRKQCRDWQCNPNGCYHLCG